MFLDLQSSDNKSEHFLRKLNRARFALARTDSVRSVRFSFIGKYPYRRASSVPMHLLNHAKPPEPHAKGTTNWYKYLFLDMEVLF